MPFSEHDAAHVPEVLLAQRNSLLHPPHLLHRLRSRFRTARGVQPKRPFLLATAVLATVLLRVFLSPTCIHTNRRLARGVIRAVTRTPRERTAIHPRVVVTTPTVQTIPEAVTMTRTRTSGQSR